MAVMILAGNPRDGSTGSGADTIDDGGISGFQIEARQGSSIFVAGEDPETGPNLLLGQYMTSHQVTDSEGHTTTEYVSRLYEAWHLWEDVTIPATEELVTASVGVFRSAHSYTHKTYATKDSLLAWLRDWTPPIASQWANLYQLALNYQPHIRYNEMMADRSASGQVFNCFEAGGPRFHTELLTLLDAGTSVGLVMAMDAELFNYPVGAYNWDLYIIASSGSTHESFKPKLRLYTIKKHMLNHVMGASLQLTDGTSVVFNWRPDLARYELRYQKISEIASTAASIGNIGDSSLLFGDLPGLQTVTICRDDSNNIYVVGAQGSTVIGNAKYFILTGFKYLGNYDWEPAQAMNLGSLSDHDAKVNNVAMTWIPGLGATGGLLAIASSRRHGKWAIRQQVLTTVNAGWVMGTTGIVANELTATHDPTPQPAANLRPMNVTGTGMDILRCGQSGKVQIPTFYPCYPNATEQFHGVLTSVIDTNGVATKPTIVSPSRLVLENDPNGKSRAVWMQSPVFDRYANMTAGYLQVRNTIDNALYRALDFTTFNITNFPSFETLQANSTWDIIWDASRNKFWIYYVDSQNPRMVRKVSYDPEANVLDPSIQFTPSSLGPSGSRIVALRAPRGRIDNRCVLVDVAMLDGALQPLDLIVLRDLSMNHAPDAPTVDPVASFNATAQKEITWNFSDLDSGDLPIAQDVEVRRVDTGSTVFTSGKVAVFLVEGSKYRYNIPANALNNDTGYQLRVRAYDAVDTTGVWSNWTSFSTSGTGGHVTITAPETDNEPLNVSHITLSWSYTNDNPAIVQNGYRVRVYNNDTNVLEQDTGILTGIETTREITGLASNVHHRVEVAVRGSDGQLSGSAVRLVFPDYSNPSIPTILGIASPGAVEIRITNPPPIGENPVTVSNQISRKESDQPDSTYIIIGTAPVNGTFYDRTVASGTNYTYRARGVAGSGATGPWSDTVTVIATLRGMWLSIPGDTAFREVSFPYGGVGRSETMDVSKTGMQYVGRRYPVYDIGEARAEALTVTTQIPGLRENSGFNTQLAAARRFGREGEIVLYRDGRGRKMYAILGGWTLTDTEQGSVDVAFTLTRVDYNEAITT
jgi:hypothetical protein